MVCSCALGQVLVCSPRVRLLGTVALTCRRGSLPALEFLKKLNKFQSWERTWSGHILMTRTPSHKDWSITAGICMEKPASWAKLPPPQHASRTGAVGRKYNLPRTTFARD